jgi:hypothetical protein
VWNGIVTDFSQLCAYIIIIIIIIIALTANGFLFGGSSIALYPQKLAITSPTSGGRSVGIVRSRTQTMEFVFVLAVVLQ